MNDNNSLEMDKALDKSAFYEGLRDGIPIGLGYFAVAFSLGIAYRNAGITAFPGFLTSITNATSAGQFAAVSIIAGNASYFEMALTTLIINARYFLMSISLTQKMDQSFTFGHRLFCSTFVTDEIFAISSSKTRSFGNKYFYGLALLPYLGWSLGTLLGSAAGSILPEIITGALGIALYAMFIAIIVPPSIYSKGVLLAVILASIISALLYYLPVFSKLSSGLAIIIAALVTALILAAIFPIKEERSNEDEIN